MPDSHPYRITSNKCRINTVVSSDDGHIVARNMWRFINILGNKRTKKNCAPSWLYLQEHCIFSAINIVALIFSPGSHYACLVSIPDHSVINPLVYGIV